MTILTSTSEAAEPYVVPWREGDPEAPRFYFRAGSIIERGQMEAEISGQHRAGKVWGFELRAAARSGIVALLPDDPGKHHLLGLLDAEGSGDAQDLSEDDKRLLAETRAILAEHWPEYRDLVAQLERRRIIAPLVALRRFCVNIVGDGVTFTRGIDGMVSDSTLAKIDEMEIAMAGNRAFGLQFPPADAEGNSPPASLSGDAPATSVSDAPSKAGGKSKARSGLKTPG